MKKILFLILIVISLPGFMACNDADENDVVNVGSKRQLPSEICIVGTGEDEYWHGKYKFSYDNINRIEKIEVLYDNGYYITSVFEYNSQGRLSKTIETARSSRENSVFTLSYNENKIMVNAEFPNCNGCGAPEITLNLDADGQITSDRLEYDNIYENSEYSYTYDLKGNISSKISSDMYGGSIYSYDDKKGSFSGVNFPNMSPILLGYSTNEVIEEIFSLIFSFANNLTKKVYYEDGEIDFTITYEYDSYGYPKKANILEYSDNTTVSYSQNVTIKYIDAK